MTNSSPIPSHIKTLITALERNNMQGYYVTTKNDVPAAVSQLIQKGETVASGGSVTLQQSGVIDLLRSGDYRYLDRNKPGLSPEEVRRIYLESFDADTYFCSCNAITQNGELINVDGNSNRVAAICYGPRSVIMVVGCNKIVKDVESGLERVKQIAAPQNTVRLSCDTYCSKTGHCVAAGKGIAAGCQSKQRICCNYVVSAQQRIAGRIKIILVGEELGY